MSGKRKVKKQSLAFILGLLCCADAFSAASEQKIHTAKFTGGDQLIRPENIDRWVFLGATVGHGYPDGDTRSFSLDSPGMIQIVQMEPAAYRYLQEHGEYADGSMLSLSFYNTQEKPSPAVDGVVQAELASFEIHILDREKYVEKRAFYIFQNGEDSAGMVPPGNACVGCHTKDADFDGTFVQFYPVLRERLLEQVVKKGD